MKNFYKFAAILLVLIPVSFFSPINFASATTYTDSYIHFDTTNKNNFWQSDMTFNEYYQIGDSIQVDGVSTAGVKDFFQPCSGGSSLYHGVDSNQTVTNLRIDNGGAVGYLLSSDGVNGISILEQAYSPTIQNYASTIYLTAPATIGVHNVTADFYFSGKYHFNRTCNGQNLSNDGYIQANMAPISHPFTVIDVTAHIYAASQVINAGASTTLTWNASGVDSCSITKSDSSGTSTFATLLGLSDLQYLTKFSSSTSFAANTSGNGITIDSSGNSYVVDAGNNRIQKFNASNTWIKNVGSLGSATEQFNFNSGPVGITHDASKLYISDPGNNRVEVYDFNLTYQKSIQINDTYTYDASGWYDCSYDFDYGVWRCNTPSGDASGCINEGPGWYCNVNATNDFIVKPSSITFNPSNNYLYIVNNNADANTPKLYVVNPANGAIINKGFNSANINGIAATSSGRIFISNNNVIQQYDANLNGVSGGDWGNGQYTKPASITFDSTGNLYVVDQGKNLIKKFDSSGSFKLMIGTTGSGNGQFNNPWGIAASSSGNIFVTDTGNNRIEVFQPTSFSSSSGALTKNTTYKISCIGKGGIGNAESSVIVYIQPVASTTVSSSSILYGASSTIFWNSTNATECKIATTSTSTAPAATSSAYKTVLATKDGSIGRYLYNIGGFSHPGGIATDVDGNLYVADTENNRVQRFSSTGTVANLTFGTLGSATGQFASPRGIAVDSAKNIYVLDSLNYRIQKFNSGGGYLASWPISAVTGFLTYHASSTSITIDKNDNIFVVNQTDKKIVKFTTAGVVGTPWTYASFVTPNEITSDLAGTYLYVSDIGANKIFKFNYSGTYQSQYGTFGTDNLQFQNPWGVDIAKNGDIYVVDQFNNRVQQLDASGNYVAQFGTGGSGSGQFNYPREIAIDLKGDFYVLDTMNNRVQKFTNGLVQNSINGKTYVWLQCNNSGMATTTASTTITPTNGAYAVLTATPSSVDYGSSTAVKILTYPDNMCTTTKTVEGVTTFFSDQPTPIAGEPISTTLYSTSTVVTKDAIFNLSCMGPFGDIATSAPKIVKVNSKVTASSSSCILGTYGANTCTSTISWKTGTTSEIWAKVGNTSTCFSNVQYQFSLDAVIATSTPTIFKMYPSATGTCSGIEPVTTEIASTTVYGLEVKAILNLSSIQIQKGDSVVLTSSSTNAQSCVASSSPINNLWNAVTAITSTTTTLTLATTTTFTFKCSNNGGTAKTASSTISKTVVVIPPPVLTLLATSPINAYSATSTITWSTSFANTCTTTASGISYSAPTTKTLSTATTSSGTQTQLGNLSTSTTITLTCINVFGDSVSTSTVIKVNPASPKGWNETTTYPSFNGCTPISGWTCDQDDYNQPLTVTLYADGTSSLNILSTIVASGTRNDLGLFSTSTCGGYVNHGFSLVTPTALKDGASHTIYAYAANVGPTASSTLLSNVGRTISCPIVTATISATTSLVDYDSSFDITFGSVNAKTCVASSTPVNSLWTGSTGIATSGKVTITNFQTNAVFAITCTSAWGSTYYASTSVRMKDPDPIIVSLNPVATLASQLKYLGTTTIVWSSANAASCSLDEGSMLGWKTGKLGTQVSDSLSENTIFTLTCTNSSASVSETKTAYVRSHMDISADLYIVPYNGSTTIRWNTSGVTNCTTTKTVSGAGTSNFDYALDATRDSGHITAGTTFTISCKEVNGGATISTTTPVIAVQSLPSITLTNYSASTITSGGTVKLGWSSTDITNGTCSVVGTSTSGVGTTYASTQNASTTKDVTLTASTTFKVFCTGIDNAIYSSNAVTVVVNTPLVADADLIASSTSVSFGSSTYFAWSSSNVSTCTTTKNGIPFSNLLNQTSTTTGSLSTTTTYTLSCTGSNGTPAPSTWIINISGGAPTSSVSASSPVNYDDEVAISLTSSNVTTCTTTLAMTIGTTTTNKILSTSTNATGASAPKERILGTTTVTMQCIGNYGNASSTKNIYITGPNQIEIPSTCSLSALTNPAHTAVQTIWDVNYLQPALPHTQISGSVTYTIKWYGVSAIQPYTTSGGPFTYSAGSLTRTVAPVYQTEGIKTMYADTIYLSNNRTYHSLCPSVSTSVTAQPFD